MRHFPKRKRGVELHDKDEVAAYAKSMKKPSGRACVQEAQAFFLKSRQQKRRWRNCWVSFKWKLCSGTEQVFGSYYGRFPSCK